MCFSIKIPYWKIIHFDSGKIVAESRFACFKGFAHYDPHGRAFGKSIRNFVGELNYYDLKGSCTGYSRRSGFATLTHFTKDGTISGKTISLCKILFVHIDATT